MKKAFTIIELMMVVAIVAILLGLITSASAGAIREAREKKASTACVVVQAGFETYYAQKGYWPGSINENRDGTDFDQAADIIELDPIQVRAMMKDLIQEFKKGNPCIDLSGLFVSRYEGKAGSRDLGLDFMEAIHGSKKDKHGQKMTTSEMYFGYPDKQTGYFRHFRVTYRRSTDSILVERQK